MMDRADGIDWARLEREARRVHLRYGVEIVEQLGLCPWARAARLDDKVRTLVSFDPEPKLQDSLARMEALEQDPRAEIGLLVFPLATLARLPFGHFVAELRVADAARKPLGETVFALADFHPDAGADLRSAERLVPFVRRCPDPTIQLVRRSALARVRRGDEHGTSFLDPSKLSPDALLQPSTASPPLAERVAHNNRQTIERLGVAQLERLVLDILRDRDRSYAAAGLTTPRRAPPA